MMQGKLLFLLTCLFLMCKHNINAEAYLSLSLNTPIIQSQEEILLIEGKNRDLGGKFKIKENRKFNNVLSVDNFTQDGKNKLSLDLTITLKDFYENIEIYPNEDEDTSDLSEEIKSLLNIPVQAKFNGGLILNDTTENDYLLHDLGLEFNFRSIFFPIEKRLEVGEVFTQEFFLRPDDAAMDEDETLPLEFENGPDWSEMDEEDLEDMEPIFLIKYTITEITNSFVYAYISGELLIASPSSTMKPTFTISGKGAWNRANPLINEIFYDFNYTEKRSKSRMNIKGFRKFNSNIQL